MAAVGGVGVVALAGVVFLATRPDVPGPLVISEVMSSNGETVADEDADHGDWIELANVGSEPVALGGLHLSDDATDPTRWRLPDRDLEPGGFVMIWASGKDGAGPTGELHTSFRIDRTGEPVLLTAQDGRTVLDRYEPIALPRDVSYGRAAGDPAQMCHFVQPTPGRANDAACLVEFSVEPPTLSTPSGFHDQPIDLELSAALDEPIFYTLDGSYPDPDGNPDSTRTYEGPLRIEDRSGDPDVWTQIRTSVFPEWEPPREPSQKATVVRARTRHGDEVVATYFIGDHLRRTGLPVFSLASDADHLFDDATGIMVPGDRHAAWRDGPEYDPEYPPRWQPANYRESGREWERPAVDDLDRSIALTYCPADVAVCEPAFNVGLRIQGGVTRQNAQKSLRVYLRNDHGPREVHLPAFGDDAPATHRRFLLRNSGSDWGRTMLMDGYVQSLATHFRMETQAFRPAVLFINGEYWGIHHVRERYDRHHLAIAHGVDPDDVILVDQPYEISAGMEGDDQPLRDLLAFVDDNDPADPQVFEHVERHLDVDGLIDYLVLQVFVGNSDWPHNNVAIWRHRADPVAGDAHPADGRWRFLAFDLDTVGAHRLDVEYDNLRRLGELSGERPTSSTGIPLLFNRLLRNDEFRVRFVSTFAGHLDTSFAPPRTTALLDDLEDLLAPEMPHHAARWNQQQPVDAWHDHVDRLRTFMQTRPGVQHQQLADFFELEGTVDLRVRTDPHQGTVRVNTFDIRAETPGVSDPSDWSGTVFLGIPLRLEAVPAEGHAFVHWDGLPDAQQTSADITFDPTADLDIRAVFEPR